MTPLSERVRARIPSVTGFLRRAASDRRLASYDLLPLLSTPASRNRVAGLIARLRPKTPDFAPSAEALQWHRSLTETGICAKLPPLPSDWIAAMRDHFCRVKCFDPYRPQLGEFRWNEVPSPEVNMAYFGHDRILAAPHVLELFNDPRVLEAAELYLGCKPMLDNIGCWWSFGGRSAAKGTQRFHRDLDSVRGFKLFLYLTEVDAAAGPHVFVAGSHRSALLDTGKAQSDEAIRQAFGPDSLVAVTGPAGTWFLADTFGFHKGELPRTGARLILVAQYNVNRTPHLAPRPIATNPAGRYDPFVNRLLLG